MISEKAKARANAYKNKWNIEWRKKNPEKYAEYNRTYTREYRRKLRKEIVAQYGGKCARCGFDDIRALQIDHLNGAGAKHRKEVVSAYLILGWLKRNKYPKGFQILCANCNWIKRFENNESNNSKRGRVRNKKV